MEQGQQSLEEDVHHAPGAVNIVSEAMSRGDRAQVRPVPDRGGSSPFFRGAWAGKSGIGRNFFSHSAAGPSHSQQRWLQRCYHSISNYLYNVMRRNHSIVLICLCSCNHQLMHGSLFVSFSRKLEANMAFPSPVRMGRTGGCSPGRMQMRLATNVCTDSFSIPLLSAARSESASSPPSMIHQVAQFDGVPQAPTARLCISE